VNHGYCSRYECAKKIIEYGNIDNCKLVPVSSVEFPLPAPRPRMEALENLHAKLISKDLMRSWQNALEEYVKTRILKEKLVSEA
jgi:dTDP-4-dehydrorhamnose reductase